MSASAWPTTGCFNSVVNNQSSDIINASLCVWANAGGTGSSVPLVSTIAIGIIPIFIMVMIYIRYQKIGPSIFGMLIGLLGITAVEVFYGQVLIAPFLMKILYILTGLGLAVTLFYAFWNKN